MSVPATPKYPARFIVLEGGEGSGKSSQLRRLAARLERLAIPAICTREPGGSPGAEEIRALLVTGEGDRWTGTTEALLFAAARSDHLARTIAPNLKQGNWVLSDRFTDSTLAYQGYARGLGAERIRQLHDWTLAGHHKPDLVIVLDLPVEQGLQRACARHGGETRFESLDVGFHHNVRAAFQDIAQRDGHNHTIIDASGSLDEVEALIWAAVEGKFFPDGVDFIKQPIASWFAPALGAAHVAWLDEPIKTQELAPDAYVAGFNAAVAWLIDPNQHFACLPRSCEGEHKEFEAWAQNEAYDMTEHPIHYLFMHPVTSQARSGWKAAVRRLEQVWQQRVLNQQTEVAQ